MIRPAPFFLSIVVPFRNYDRSISSILQDISIRVAPLVADYEIVVVDNGSTDEEFADYAPLIGGDGFSNIQLYRLIQHVETDLAAWAGLENCLGDFMLVYDPRSETLECLADAVAKVQDGYEVVFLRNTSSTDRGLIEKLGGPLFRWMYRHLTGLDLNRQATPGRLISKRVVSYLLMQPYPGMRYRSLPAIAGFRCTTLTYSSPRARDPRYGLAARMRSGIHLTVSSSILPLRFASTLALIGAGLNLLYTVYVAFVVLFKTDVAAGWTTLSLQQSGMFFLLSIVLFMLTEYLIQMIRWSSDGPRYFISAEATSERLARRERLNVEQVQDRTVDLAGQ